METITNNLNYKNYNFFLQLKDSIRSFDEINKEKITEKDWKNLFHSQIFFNAKEYPKSKNLAQEIIQNSNGINPILLAESYNLLGRIARLYKLNDDANAFYTKAEEYFKQDNSFYGKFGTLRIDFNRANILLLNSDLSHAIKSFDKLIEYIDELQPPEELKNEFIKMRLKIFQNKALTFLYLGKTKESQEYFENALSLVDAVSNTTIEADLYLNYSNLAIIQENFSFAYELLSKASSLYKENNRPKFAHKVELDKIKINLLSNIDQTINLDLINDIKTNFENAKGKDVNLRAVEIAELLMINNRIDDAQELLDFLLQKDFLPDLHGRLLLVLLNIQLNREQYNESIETCNELLEISKSLNDTESEIAINLYLIKAKFMLNKDEEYLITELKRNLSPLLKNKDAYETVILTYEQYIPVLFDDKKYSVIISILEEFESKILNKLKDKNVKEYHTNDLIISFALNENKKALDMFKKRKSSLDELIEMSRFKTKLSENPLIKKQLEDFLEIA